MFVTCYNIVNSAGCKGFEPKVTQICTVVRGWTKCVGCCRSCYFI